MHTQMLSCDWGTSSFRLRLVNVHSGAIIHESISDEGIRPVHNAWIKAGADESSRMPFYLAVIDRHIQLLQQKEAGIPNDLPVIISGMASSSIGIKELPYSAVPFLTDGKNIEVMQWGKQDFFAHPLVIISGASTGKDVMRGEETQLIGCAAGNNSGKQLFIFPGTHSKHVTTLNDAATDISTYMTGELFSLLAEKSILAASILPSGGDEQENNGAFAQGIKAGKGGSLSHSLFLVRTNQLLHRFSKEANYHFLNGLLIGSELEALSKKAVDSITLVGEARLLAHYLEAFAVLSIDAAVSIADAATATIHGQLAVYRRLYA
jgi:2-dehydro-3-deoxygalactonokinase